MDFVPEVSALEQEFIEVDVDTRDMLEALNFKDLSGVKVSTAPMRN